MTRAMSALPSSFFAFCVSFMTLSAQPLVSLTFPLLLAPRPPSQPLQGRDLPRPLDHRHRRRAAHAGASGYVVLGMATTGNLGTRANLDVAHRPGLAAHDHEVPKLRGTGNAGLADDDTMPTDHHVVPDLHKIINFGAFPDHCIGEGAAVDAAVGADFHVVVENDTADLRHLEVALGAHGKAKPVLAYAHACVQDHPVTDDGVDEAYPGANVAVAPNHHPIADHRACRHGAAGADARLTSDHGTRFHPRAGLDHGAGVQQGLARPRHRRLWLQRIGVEEL